MAFTRLHLYTLCDIIRDAAEQEILPRFRNLEQGAIREKSSRLDLVTDADEAAEVAIRKGVAKAFPSALFVGEESVEKDKSLLAKLHHADLAVVVDPVDGTANFAWGLPLFGVLAAVVAKGETIAGLIYDPIGKDWTLGLRGEGAWGTGVTGENWDLKTAVAAPLSEMTGIASWYLMPEPMRSRVVANLAKTAAAFAYRNAAHEYRLVASGLCHFTLYHKLMPWDHAAGVLIHAEAGGYSARFDGSAYSPLHTDGGLISAPDRHSWSELREALLGQ
jgi:fructose-1,6-bisphosphatase/inositol monophosphatase family enzyme